MKVSTACRAIICLLVAIVPGTLSQGCPAIGDTTSTVRYLPHETDCNKFYQCANGIPVLILCNPPILHFDTNSNVCDWPANVGCVDKNKCLPLTDSPGSVWSPASCTQGNGKLGDLCTIQCAPGYEHKGGDHFHCEAEGWVGQFYPETPTCFLIDDLVDNIVDVINETLAGRDANFLFILDESGSVTPPNFVLVQRFVKSLVGGFPLSVHRVGGIITFATGADVDSPLKEENTCSFMQQTDQIIYSGGWTYMDTALELGLQEIKTNGVHPLTLVFLVTDGESNGPSPPGPAADALKANPNNILFALGVAGYNPSQLIPLASLDKNSNPLFYGIDSFEIFERIADYLETKYNPNGIVCP